MGIEIDHENPLPDFSGIPSNASPLGTDAEKAAWNAMSDAQRDSINRVFANIGKAIAAFERSIEPPQTRFDRFALDLAIGAEPKGDAVFTREEILGLKLFIGKANCVTCHNGPRFTDNGFHNTGVPPVAGLPPDRGRIDAVSQVEADPFNCFGAFRDGDVSACGELRFMVKSAPELIRAYKTPSLRGAPEGHEIKVTEVRLSRGAGFVVVVCGNIMTMPGLPKVPASMHISLSDEGVIAGLS